MSTVRKSLLAVVCAAALVGGGSAAAVATPPTGTVAVTPIARGTIGPLELKAPGGFELEQHHRSDFVVAGFTLKPGASLGWHQHPGPVLITVQQGTLTIEHSDCTYSKFSAGTSEVEAPRQVHIAWNKSGRTTVKGTAVYLNVPVGGLPRIDAKAPSCTS